MTDQPAMTLEPCPFCGGEAELQNFVVEASVSCKKCRAKVVRKHIADYDTGINEVVNAWNLRPSLPRTNFDEWYVKASKTDRRICMIGAKVCASIAWEAAQASLADAHLKSAQEPVAELTFAAFRRANVQRCVKWHPEGIGSWSPSDWLTAVTGELGELASLIKMRNRERDGLPGNKFSPTQKQIADEIADVLTYLDLLAEAHGVDLGNAAVQKFNEVSERVGFPDRITLNASTPPPVTVQVPDAEAYAATLAQSLWNKYYKDDAPNWELAEDHVGVLSQIDNMCAGLVRAPPAASPAGYDARKYKLVPIEATDAMCEPLKPYVDGDIYKIVRRKLWQAMLAAAPSIAEKGEDHAN
jgi:NTP pyrophosphatase (non-canonical NTP hydrolase)